MRSQLTDGKDFVEKYLQSLMESTFQIKDKEQKVNKIMGIISDIDTQLAKVLVLRPYSPRTLQKMKQKQKEEQEEETKRLKDDIYS